MVHNLKFCHIPFKDCTKVTTHVVLVVRDSLSTRPIQNLGEFYREARHAKYQQEKTEKEEALRQKQQEKINQDLAEAARIAAENRYTLL